MTSRDALLSVAAAVSDGTPIDWMTVTGALDDRDRRLLDQLRLLQGVVQFHTLLPPPPVALPSDPLFQPAGDLSFDGEARADGATWGPLRVLERVGRGAHGDVYRAWDTRLDREVALKVLRHRNGHAGTGSSAIVEEARLLARVRHPNVLAVYGADIVDGRVGFWSQFIHGHTLEDEIRERGPFDAAEIVRVGAVLCEALAAVHTAGLLHRDVKAQNVMRDADGNLVLADFGTVRELQEHQYATADMAGTPAYLAPEILNGDRASVQSDVYSLGVLLFRIASGSLPAIGRTVDDLRQVHANGRSRNLAALRPDLAAGLVAVVDRALAPDPHSRFESAQVMASALTAALTPAIAAGRARRSPVTRRRWLAAGCLMLAALGGVTWWAVIPRRAPVPFAARDAVLVASIENLTGDEVLDDSLQYALESELSNSRFLRVVPRERINDALRLMRRPPDTQLDAAVAREVALRDGGIPVVLVGRVERLDQGYVLTSQIVAAADGAVVGSTRLRAASVDQFLPAVRRHAERLRELLGENASAITSSSPPLAKVTTHSLRALQLYSRALAVMSQEPMNNSVARELLAQAVAEDPEFAIANVLLSHALENLRLPPAEYVPPAERARKLLTDAATDYERHFVLGRYHAVRHDWEAAVAAYGTLLELRPDDYWAAHKLRMVLQLQGRTPPLELLESVARARPLSVRAQADLALASYRAGLDDRAMEYTARTVIAPGPDALHPRLRAGLEIMPAVMAWAGGDVGRADALADGIARSLPDRPADLRGALSEFLAGLYLTLGRFRAAQVLADTLEKNQRFGFAGLLLAEYGDAGRLRAELRSQLRAVGMAKWPKNLSWLSEAGMLHEAREALGYLDRSQPGSEAYAELQLGIWAEQQGRLDAALEHLNRSLDRSPPLQHHVRASEHLARVLRRQGDLAAAAKILEEATRDRRRLYAPDNPLQGGYQWVRLRTQLAALYAEGGRTNDAARLRTELRNMLARADPDHPFFRQTGGK